MASPAARASRPRRLGVIGLLIALFAGVLLTTAEAPPAHAGVDDFSFESLVVEFYWDVNGTAWPQSFGRITAHVTMTDEVDAARTGAMACYVGSQGSTATCPIADAGDGVEASATDV